MGKKEHWQELHLQKFFGSQITSQKFQSVNCSQLTCNQIWMIFLSVFWNICWKLNLNKKNSKIHSISAAIINCRKLSKLGVLIFVFHKGILHVNLHAQIKCLCLINLTNQILFLGKSGLINLLRLIKNRYYDIKVYFWSVIQNSRITEIFIKIE